MNSDQRLAPPKLELGESDLAQIGRATAYETQAKTFLSLCLKRLLDLSHDEWVREDRRQFKDIVSRLTDCLKPYPSLSARFHRIASNHERWRDARNFVVHSVWGTGADGRPQAYCYRRRMLGDENDIVRAVNDCFWLAKEAYEFAYEIALAVDKGDIGGGTESGPGISIRTPNGWMKF